MSIAKIPGLGARDGGPLVEPAVASGGGASTTTDAADVRAGLVARDPDDRTWPGSAAAKWGGRIGTIKLVGTMRGHTWGTRKLGIVYGAGMRAMCTN